MSRTVRCLTLVTSLVLVLAATPTLGQEAEPSCDPLATDACPSSSNNDVELEAMFPTAITGAERIRVETNMLHVVLAQLEEDDPERAASTAEVFASVVGPLDRSLEDVSLGEGAFRIGDGAEAVVGRIDALRVRGADTAALLDTFLDVSGMAEAERTRLQIDGKDVIVLSPDDRDQYLYAAGDVVWNVYQQGGSPISEETLAEIVRQLP